MNQLVSTPNQEEWIKVLGKGMITIPKKWREDLGITEGKRIKATREADKVIIESQTVNTAPYRTYTDKEIDTFLQDDVIPANLAKKIEKKLSPSVKQ